MHEHTVVHTVMDVLIIVLCGRGITLLLLGMRHIQFLQRGEAITVR